MSNLNKEPAYVKRNRIKKEQKARYLKQQAEKLRLKKIADAKRAAEFKGGKVPTGEKVTVTNKNNEYVPKKNNKVDSSLQEAVKRKKAKDAKAKDAKAKADATRKSTREQQSKVTTTKKKNTVKKIIENKPQPSKMPQSIKDMRAKNDAKKDKKTGSKKTAASASNTKDFAKTKKIQEELNKMGADINADGIMGAKTRAAMAKYKAKPTSSEKKTFNSAYSNEKLTTQQRLAEAKEEVANPEKKRAKFNTPKSKKALAAAFKMLKKKK